MSQIEEQTLSSLSIQDKGQKLERNLLKDMAADALRDYISTGRIPEGTKLTEREVSRMLGISRMPVHDAFMILETEGLVVRRGGVRYVVQLSEQNVRDLHVVRRILEKEAAEQAAMNVTAGSQAALYAALEALEQAAATGDHHLTAKCDMALHQIIWQQADNKYLLELLNSLVGVIFVLNDRVRVYSLKSKRNPLGEHRRMIEHIVAGDATQAGRTMEAHLNDALTKSLATFHMVNKDTAT